MLACALALALAACGGGGGGAANAGGGGAPAGDAVDRTRDLSAHFVDGMVVGLPGDVAVGPFPASTTPSQLAALLAVNRYRSALDLAPLAMSAPLNRAATDHAACRVDHAADYAGRSPDSEDPAWGAPCRGVDPLARLRAAGGEATFVAECNGTSPTPSLVVDRWMVGLYERLPVVYPTTTACGYGDAPAGAAPVNVMGFVRGPTTGRATWEPVLWPRNGASDVGTTWAAKEGALPPGVARGSATGPIITLTWAGEAFAVQSHDLRGPDGAAVRHHFLDAATDPRLAGWDTVALIPEAPLERGASYLVILEVTAADGAPRTIDWAFQTRGTAG